MRLTKSISLKNNQKINFQYSACIIILFYTIFAMLCTHNNLFSINTHLSVYIKTY